MFQFICQFCRFFSFFLLLSLFTRCFFSCFVPCIVAQRTEDHSHRLMERMEWKWGRKKDATRTLPWRNFWIFLAYKFLKISTDKKFPIIHFWFYFRLKKIDHRIDSSWGRGRDVKIGMAQESCKIRNVDPITFFIIRCHKSFTLLKLLKLMIFFCCSLNLHSACLLAIFYSTQFSSFLFIGLSSTNPVRSGKIKKSPEKSRSINVRGALGLF